jgi:hypothetical protein
MNRFESRASVLLLALWFGLVTGFGELALLGLRRFALHRFLFVGRDIIWMTPVADAVMFVLLGAGFLLLRRATSGRVTPVHLVGFLTTVGCFALLLHYGPLHRGTALVLAIGIGVQAARVWSRREAPALQMEGRTLPLLAG